MSKQKPGRNLVVQSGELGIINQGTFQSYTYFSMEIAFPVTSPKTGPSMFGYVYKITSGRKSIYTPYINIYVFLFFFILRNVASAQTKYTLLIVL